MKPHEINSRCIISIIDKLFPFLPKRLRCFLHFGYEFRDEKAEEAKLRELDSSRVLAKNVTKRVNEAFEFDQKTFF
jgi:hypothetical protein